MKISARKVEKICELAKIELAEKEVQKMSRDLSSVLDYAEKLEEVDTADVEPACQATGLKNVRRPDKVDYDFEKTDMLESAPETAGDLIKVRKIFD